MFMFDFEGLKTVFRILQYWKQTNLNSVAGISDFIILRNALSMQSLMRLEDFCAFNRGVQVSSERVDERYVFSIDQHIWAEISSNESVTGVLRAFSPFSRPQHFMRNRIIDTSNEIGSGGGWHRDSFQPQLKIFIPLTDIDENSGPTQYVSGTSSNLEKLKDALSGRRKSKHFRPQSFHSLYMKRGDIAVVNTSGIHRGAPPEKPGRDVVTVYMNDAFKNVSSTE